MTVEWANGGEIRPPALEPHMEIPAPRRAMTQGVVVDLAQHDAAALLEDDVVRFAVSLDDLSMMRLRQALAGAKVKVPPGWAQMVAGRRKDAAAGKVGAPVAGAGDFERGDHVELATALIDKLRSDAPVVADLNALHSYDEERGIWSPVEHEDASKVVQGFAGAWVVGGSKPSPLKIRASDVEGSIKLALHQAGRPHFFAEAAHGLAFLGAFVRLDGARVVVEPHHPDHGARFCYPFAYDPAAPCARWLGCLEDAFQGDEDAGAKIAMIQEFAGASLFGMATKFQRCLMLTGDGANAKSTIAEIIEAAFPAESTCAVTPQTWGQEYRLAMMAGKILNVVLELPEDDIMVPECFKSMIDGTAMTAREIREKPFKYKPRMGHLFAANRLPGTTDHTHGFWRRWLVIEFHRVFKPEEQNPNLRDEIISSELQGIVAWLVEGARRVAARGRYVVPGSTGKAIERWRRQADPVAIFVSEKTRPVRSDVERMSASALFAAYVTWAETNKYRVMSAGKFGQRMRGLGLRSEHTRTGEVYPVRLPALGEPLEEPAEAVTEQELAEAAAREAAEADAEDAWRREP